MILKRVLGSRGFTDVFGDGPFLTTIRDDRDEVHRCDVERKDKVPDSRHAIPSLILSHLDGTLAQLSSYVQTVYQREAVAWHTA
jgi:hypothetical protein